MLLRIIHRFWAEVLLAAEKRREVVHESVTRSMIAQVAHSLGSKEVMIDSLMMSAKRKNQSFSIVIFSKT